MSLTKPILSSHPSKTTLPVAQPPAILEREPQLLRPACEIIASRVVDPKRPEGSLEAAMQSLVLDAHRPVALEIAGDGATGAKQFLIRAADWGALDHAQAHLRAYAPQIQTRMLTGTTDPFCLRPGEAVSCCELRPGAASYLPLRQMEKTDPLRGVLASLSVPPDLRAVVQIALVPAIPTWARRAQRKAVEHPLERERQHQREALVLSRVGAPSTAGLVWLAAVFLVMLGFSSQQQALPSWTTQALAALLRGQLPLLSGREALLFYGGLSALLIGPFMIMMACSLLRHLIAPPVYDQRAVARKTSQMAYRAKVRLYVLGPGPSRSLVRLGWQGFCLVSGSLLRWGTRRLLKRQPDPHGWKRTTRLWQRYWHLLRKEQTWRRAQRQRRHEGLARLIAAFRQFDTASANYFVPAYASESTASRLVQGQWDRGVNSSRHFLTSDFLSRAWYLPQESLLELPGLEQKRARTLLVPTCLIAPKACPLIGFSIHAGYRLPFALPPGFLAHHTLIAGKTGEGKSTLMTHIALAAMREGSLFLLDPHGDLAYDVLGCVPEVRREDVVFLDLGDREFSVGLNPLDVTLGRDRDLTVASLVETFRTIWESGWGPRMEAPFRSALMTLYEANEALVREGRAEEQYTLLDVVQVLLDEGFCHGLLQQVQDHFLHRFWFEYFETLDPRQWRERIDPVITKMLQFESRVARRILGQSRSTLNLAEFMAERKIVVVRLAIGEAGLAAPLLGATLLGLLMVAIREQSVLPVEARARTTIIVDEFQSMPGADYNLLLAELRKFGAAATLATQSFEYVNKLNPHLLATTLANSKQYFIFRTSAQDARLISREIDVTEEDIVNMDTYSRYVRLVYQQRQQPTFSLRLVRPPQPHPALIERLRLRSRRYTNRSAEVEQLLEQALARHLGGAGSDREQTPSRHATARTQRTRDSASMKTSSGPGVVDGSLVESRGAVPHEKHVTPLAENSLLPSSLPVNSQGAGASSPPKETSHRFVHFEKRRKPEQTDDAISSFDVYPLGEQQREEHEA